VRGPVLIPPCMRRFKPVAVRGGHVYDDPGRMPRLALHARGVRGLSCFAHFGFACGLAGARIPDVGKDLRGSISPDQ
jgi:hypothetical protein